MKKVSDILRQIPLAPKLLALTALVGIVVWGGLDYSQTRKLRSIFEANLARRLSYEAQSNRMRFDGNVAAFQQAAKLIVSQKNIIEYATHLGQFRSRGVPVTWRLRIPSWLPDASVMRKFANIHYAILIDAHGTVREAFQGWPVPPPASLLQPSMLLREMSHNQSFMTTLDGLPFLLTSESIVDADGHMLATLILAVNLDDDFLMSSLGLATEENIAALAAGDPPAVIASNRPESIQQGTPLASLRKSYLVIGKSFFDWGSSDLTVQLISLISRAEADRMNASILATERLQRAIVAFSLLLAFAAIMFWISRHIRSLSQNMAQFSHEVLGIRHETRKGDELFEIETQFGSMTREIVNARETLQREAEEKALLLRKTMEVDRQEQEIRFLQALKLSEENYRSIYDAANDAIFVYDMQTGDILDSNTKMTELYGYSTEEARTLTIDALSSGEHPYNEEGIREHLARAAAGEPQLFEWHAKDRSGRTFWVEVNLKRAAIGGKARILAIERDITERKRTAQRLAVQYTVTRLLAESASLDEATPRILQSICDHVGWELGELWLVDPESSTLHLGGTWQDALHDFTEFNALSRRTVFRRGIGLPGRVWEEGRPAWINDVVTDANFPRFSAAVAAGLHAGFAFPIRSKNVVIGVMDFFSRSVQPPDDELLKMFDALGSQIGSFMMRKNAEHDAARYSLELERSNKELEMFASIASHDLQEPLRGVAGFAQLLERKYKGRLDKDADNFIGYIVDGVGRMQRLIRDLLQYSRVTTRGNPFTPANCDLVMQAALTNLNIAIKESNAVITADSLPVVTADESQLVHLFQNLVGNAVKYRKKDEAPRVHISAKHLSDPAAQAEITNPQFAVKTGWLFSVQDNGIGIEDRFYDRIFQVFQRLHRREEYPGTGIGLAICKKIVERHGGGMWVKSEPGKGSTFFFTMPEHSGGAAGDGGADS